MAVEPSLPTLSIDPCDLIALARWEHFQEIPVSKIVQRLHAAEIALPSTGFLEAMPVDTGVEILDQVVRAQVEAPPDREQWWRAAYEASAETLKTGTSFTVLTTDPVIFEDVWRRRFIVLTGTRQLEPGRFELTFVEDPQSMPWWPFNFGHDLRGVIPTPLPQHP